MPTSLLSGPVIGGLIGAAGSIFGSNEAADAAKASADMQMKMYQQNRANLQPWMTTGANALGTYGNAIGLGGAGPQNAYYADFKNDPYLRGILESGTNTIQNAALARGRGYGGNVLSDLNRYSMDIQRQAYNDRLNHLFGVSEAGRGAAGSLAGQGTTAAANAGNLNANAGYAQGAGYMGAANALGQGLVNYGKANPNALGNFFGNLTIPSFV